MHVGKHIEVAAWKAHDQYATRIPAREIPPWPDGRQRGLWCHFLVTEDFRFARDDTNYAEPVPGTSN
jgi:hypothetical protein